MKRIGIIDGIETIQTMTKNSWSEYPNGHLITKIGQ